jgi:hypothetical protein
MSAKPPAMETAHVVRLKLSARARSDTSTALRESVSQIPEASTMEPGTLVAIAGEADSDRGRGFLGRIAAIGARPQIHRAMRCTGLLARGYVRVAAGTDDHGVDWAWGYVP